MRQCAICGKTSQLSGKRHLLRGHYNPTPKTRRYPNLQWGKVNGQRVKMCVKCLRSTQAKQPAVAITS